MSHHTKEFSVSVNGSNVDVISFGTGSKPLVMIPGLRLSGLKGASKPAAWYYRMFAREYTVYMPDRKDPAVPGCTIHDLAEDVAGVMGALGITGAYVFGASQGGMIAQELAIHHPELVKKMVLGVTLSRSNDTVQEAVSRWIALMQESGLSAVAGDYIHRGFSEQYLRKYGRFIPLAIKMQKFMPAERWLILAKACLTCNTYDDLEKIKCPVLVLGGGKDKVVSGEASLEIARKLNCPHYIYETLSHEAYNEAPDFNRRIYDFFAG